MYGCTFIHMITLGVLKRGIPKPMVSNGFQNDLNQIYCWMIWSTPMTWEIPWVPSQARQVFGCPAAWGCYCTMGFIFQTSNVDNKEVKSHEITDEFGMYNSGLLKIVEDSWIFFSDDNFERLWPRVLLKPKVIRCLQSSPGLCESFCAATFFRGTGTGAGTGIASGAKHSLTCLTTVIHGWCQ